MSKTSENKQEKYKVFSFFIILFFILALGTSLFAVYEIFLLDSIEDVLRYVIMSLLLFVDFVLFYRILKYFKKKKKKKKGFLIFLFIYALICGIVGGTIAYVYGQLSGINKAYVTYTSDLIMMSSNEKVNDINDIKDMKIGILKDKKSPEGYIIPQEIIKEEKLEDDNEITSYDDYTTMLVDMYANEIDAMFVSDHYVTMFSGITGYENIATDTKVITSKDKKMRKADTGSIETASAGKSITEPFTILLMGIDSTDDVLTKNAIANGDTLILITFNPKTLNATMFSIPRDSYVPIACWSGKPENKITHAAAYGNDCMINTIEEYFDTKIDYYAKINFKGMVKLVDAVGGVEVDVEQDLCTDNSNREKEVCIHPGHQVLNGEEALVFARNRKQLVNGTFGRDAHQQQIIMALVNKMKTIKDVGTFMDILNTVSNSLDTNLTTKQILSFYNVGKDIIKKSLSSSDADLVNIQQLYLQGTGQMIYDERAKMVLWDYVPNKSSKKDIIEAMDINLGKKEHKDITEFHFSINEPYTKKIIGEGPYKTDSGYTLLPDFTGDSESQARATASKMGISVSFNGSGGYVTSQNYPAKKRVDLIKGNVVLTLSGGKNTVKKDDDTKNEKENTRSTEKNHYQQSTDTNNTDNNNTPKVEPVDDSKEDDTNNSNDNTNTSNSEPNE